MPSQRPARKDRNRLGNGNDGGVNWTGADVFEAMRDPFRDIYRFAALDTDNAIRQVSFDFSRTKDYCFAFAVMHVGGCFRAALK